MTQRVFPENFIWGTATAAYQVEGGVAADGRTPSIWDTFCAGAGNILDGSNGDVACDQYHRYPQDVQLMKELGTNAYRFSIAWPRIQPSADGVVNQKGIDYYSRLVDELLQAGISPVVTLYHWDLPQYLQDLGGWPNRDVAYRFAEYAQVMVRALGDRVHTWSTLNEPWCVAYLGYAEGSHAPGLHDHPASLRAAHHLNLAHGLGIQAIRSVLPDARTSVTLNLQALYPASETEADRGAVAQLQRVANDIWLLPILEGRYDPQLFADTAHVTDWSFVKDQDLAEVKQPLSVLGVNYYSTTTVRRNLRAQLPSFEQAAKSDWVGAWPGAETIEFLPPVGPLTEMGWNQNPAALTELLLAVHNRYPALELMITENGSAFADEVGPDYQVHDPKRVAYLAAHIEAIGQAIDAGVPLTGYFAWSLLDNFEWAFGYGKRFGLFFTDYQTQERIWKDSARWYQQLAKANRVPSGV
ncbi:MAG: beta-glucosidase [Propionibacteriaceae bacterium]|jgi:beta-glucosidase|nr:beta-glucosidase [Propionibacteriaceae bacterium]